MLTARPKQFFSRSYTVADEHGPVAAVDLALMGEGGQLTFEDKVYRIRREGMMSGAWQLVDDGEVVFEARKPSMIKNRFVATVKGASLELSPTSRTLRAFRLVGPDWVDLGKIRKPTWLSRRVSIELSDMVPPLAQLFFFVLAVVIWNRAADSGAASS